MIVNKTMPDEVAKEKKKGSMYLEANNDTQEISAESSQSSQLKFNVKIFSNKNVKRSETQVDNRNPSYQEPELMKSI